MVAFLSKNAALRKISNQHHGPSRSFIIHEAKTVLACFYNSATSVYHARYPSAPDYYLDPRTVKMILEDPSGSHVLGCVRQRGRLFSSTVH